ncbi:TonB-dependent receptor [Stakelama sediminis]|uniref:TonB-dependent receptor n=1 Tax=Stakelama sediminis TaxID=463200 RepID=A0A840YYM8_9SPHN|nr:TonB-dependent receptor [Stakelama sediminis]MBB5718624.1 TonB-dependent receptor [Stakelama sediminis]
MINDTINNHDCMSERFAGRSKMLLAGATSLVALCVAASPVAAAPLAAKDAATVDAGQNAATPTTDDQNSTLPKKSQQAATTTGTPDIVVTGIIGSLQRNLDAKRDAPGVIDMISSEDIGKFPDSNVAAAMQRLPGISIQRDGTRGDATGITVRGFGGDFNTTLYDGRRISTAAGGRSVDFSTVGADFIGNLTVLKTPDVTLSSNSIGATINIEFPKPFDHPGFRAAATASGNIQDASGKITPTIGALVSDTFANDTLGVLADVIYTRRDTQTNNVYVHGWPGNKFAPCQMAGTTATVCNPQDAGPGVDPNNAKSIVGWFEQQYGAQQIYSKDERVDGRLALQWHPSESVMVTLDDNYSRQKLLRNNVGFGIWFNQGNFRNIVQDSNGTITDFTQANTQTDFTAETSTQIRETNQVGLNLKWDVNDNLSFNADASYARSTQNPNGEPTADDADVGYGGSLAPTMGITINGDSRNSLPELHGYGPGGNADQWADTSLIGSHVTVRQAQQNSDSLKQFHLIGTWKQDDFQLKFGGQYVDDHFKQSQRNTFVNNFWQAYAGYGPASGSAGGVALPGDLFQGTISTDNFIPGYSGALPPVLLRISPAQYQAYLSSLGNPQAMNIPGFNYSGTTVGNTFTGTFDLALDPSSIRDITEKTWSLFMRADFKTEIAGMPFNFNAGIREESTNISSSGLGQVPVQILTSQADPTLLTIVPSATQPITTKSSYSYLLPSIDMKLELTDKFHLRFDASRTLTRPSLSVLSPVLSVGTGQRIGALSASGGNPSLKPYLSDNFDFAAEWYYQSNSYASVDFFIKNVSNFIVGGTQNQTINDVIDPTTGQKAVFAVTQQVNGPDATVKGVELAWQHVFGQSGFGFNANATFVTTNKPYDPKDISLSGFAVTGLANSANFVGFYEKHGFQFRAALNYRAKYLLQFGQVQNTGLFGSEPTYVDPSLQLDLSSSYDFNDHISVFGEITNVTDQVQSTHGRFSNQLLDVYNYGRRFTAGVRFHF